MKHSATLLAGLLITGPVPALQVEGKVITLTDPEVAQCAAEGGCFVASRQAIAAALRIVQANAAESCRARRL